MPFERGSRFRAGALAGAPFVLLPALLAAVGTGCGGEERAPAEEPGPSPREEFEAIAERLRRSTNETFGQGAIPLLRNALQRTDLPPARRREACIGLSQELLRVGGVDEAIELLDQAIAATVGGGRRPGPADAELYRARALAHLRRAELENCVRRHDRECCILPLQGGGLHQVSEPARLAREDLERYLEATAGAAGKGRERVTARWLLNVACMALGEYPDGVPEEHLVPPSALDSGHDLGRFVDAAPRLGVAAFDHAGGAVADDLDGDGRLDLVSTTCAPGGPMKAFRNAGDGTFEDVSSAWGLGEQLGGLHLLGADYDNDGGLDLFVLRGAWMFDDGRIRNSLLRNDGRGRFEDVTRAAGVAEPAFPTQAAAWADLDGDGWLDLYVGNESPRWGRNQPRYPSQLFRSNRDGTFTDVATEARVANLRYAKGVAVGDHDRDGDVDVFVSNFGGNRLYRNDGGMRFTDVAREAGVRDPERSFASWFFDYDEDGDLDLWVSSYYCDVADVVLDWLGRPNLSIPPSLYRNGGDGTFRDVAAEVGLDHAWQPMGAGFGDLDGDGWLDVYLGTGEPSYEAIVPNVALRNDGGTRFQDVTFSAGLGHLQKGHGVVFADVDDDGDQDLFHQLGGFYPDDAFRNALFLNPGHGNRHLALELVGVRTNRMAAGARIEVRVETPDGPRTIHRDVGSISSFGSVPRRQEIGLGRATAVAAVDVWWPVSGLRQTFRDVELDRAYRIVEGEPELEPIDREPLPLGEDPVPRR